MSNKKNIDRLFQEKFKDFEAEPNDAVWSRISDSLHGKKKKRRLVPIWWQIGGVAAAIALLLTIGVSVFSSNANNPQDLPVVNTDKNDTEENKPTDQLNQKDLNSNTTVADSDADSKNIKNRSSQEKENSNQSQLQSNKAVATNSKENQKSPNKKLNKLTPNPDKGNTKVATNTKLSNSSSENSDGIDNASKDKIKSEMEKSLNDSKNVVTDNSTSDSSNSENSNAETNITDGKDIKTLIGEELDKKQSIEDAIAENTEAIDEKEEEKLSRWSIAPNVAPVYFSSLGRGSSIDQQFNENSKSSDINMSYGIVGSYAISKKIKLRTGINRLSLNRTTSDVLSFTGPASTARGVNAQFSNITFKDGVQTVSIVNTSSLNRSSAPEVFNTDTTGDLDQRFGFIEVPLEIEYRLLDQKFGINVVGGFSTFFLNENEIYADIDGSSTFIGEANNINSTSFSANFGLGMDYSITKQLNINLEPTFKYQINTFNNTTGNFRPFFIGVYTGLSFKF